MTYHDNNTPKDSTPKTRPYGRGSQRTGFVWMLGLLAVLIMGGLMLMTIGRGDNAVTRIDRPGATTGTGSTVPAPANRDMRNVTNAPTTNRPTAPAPKQ